MSGKNLIIQFFLMFFITVKAVLFLFHSITCPHFLPFFFFYFTSIILLGQVLYSLNSLIKLIQNIYKIILLSFITCQSFFGRVKKFLQFLHLTIYINNKFFMFTSPFIIILQVYYCYYHY